MLGWLLKKIVSRLLFPLPVCSLLLLAGVVLLVFSRRRRTGLFLSAAALGLLLALGYGVPAKAILRQLEWQQAPPPPDWSLASVATELGQPIWIVVLGGSVGKDESLPACSRLNAHFLARVVEGFRLLRQEPRAKLLLSLPGRLSPAQKRVLADGLCASLGAAPERIHLVPDALDTVDEARSAALVVGDAPVALVTSAAHMPRSLRLFAGVGLHPLPCPTDFLTARPGSPPGEFSVLSLFPSAENVSHSEGALYEYLGLAWARLRGQAPRLGAPAPPTR
jgi:uncharacterized SAM-binding protein YcdF (DUF218 family)